MNRIPAVLGVSVVINLLIVGVAFDNLHHKTDEEVLRSGRVQFFDYPVENDKSYRVGAILIDAPPGVIWQILNDTEMLGVEMPYMEYQKTRHALPPLWYSRKDKVIVEGRFSIQGFPAQYTVEVTSEGRDMWRRWRMLTPDEIEAYREKGVELLQSGGLIGNIEGFEYLEAFDGGSRTIYYYSLMVDSTIPLPEFTHHSLRTDIFAVHLETIRRLAVKFKNDTSNRNHE